MLGYAIKETMPCIKKCGLVAAATAVMSLRATNWGGYLGQMEAVDLVALPWAIEGLADEPRRNLVRELLLTLTELAVMLPARATRARSMTPTSGLAEAALYLHGILGAPRCNTGL